MDPLSCLRCGHRWRSKSATPKRCPKCKSVRWNIPDGMTYRCSLCGYDAPTKQAVSSHIRFTDNTKDGPFAGPHGAYGDTPPGAQILEERP